MAADHPPADRVDFILSVLLHVASILPVVDMGEADEEARVYQKRLEKFWALARPYFADRILPPTRRWYAGVRPSGFPSRRLAAVARLLQRLGEGGGGLLGEFTAAIQSHDPDTLSPKDLRKFIQGITRVVQLEPVGHFFETHFTLAGKKQNPQSLLGEPAARSLAFNVLLPLAVLDARRRGDTRQERAAWAVVHLFPALDGNSITKFMTKRLFAESTVARAFAAREIHQQALFKIFMDCCAENERTCDQCTFLSLAGRHLSAPIPS